MHLVIDSNYISMYIKDMLIEKEEIKQDKYVKATIVLR